MTAPRPPNDAIRKSSFRELVEPEIEVLLRVALTLLLTILRNTNANLHCRQRPGTFGDWELIRTARPAFGRAELPSAEDSFVDHELHADLILVDVHDLSYSEAAAVMRVPVGTVMSRLSRARDRVRKSLRFSPLTRGDLS